MCGKCVHPKCNVSSFDVSPCHIFVPLPLCSSQLVSFKSRPHYTVCQKKLVNKSLAYSCFTLHSNEQTISSSGEDSALNISVINKTSRVQGICFKPIVVQLRLLKHFLIRPAGVLQCPQRNSFRTYGQGRQSGFCVFWTV